MPSAAPPSAPSSRPNTTSNAIFMEDRTPVEVRKFNLVMGRRRQGSGSTVPIVIPGWSEGPDPESRDSGFDAFASPRNDGREAVILHFDAEALVSAAPKKA